LRPTIRQSPSLHIHALIFVGLELALDVGPEDIVVDAGLRRPGHRVDGYRDVGGGLVEPGLVELGR
jgi:hypothetical protein